MSKNSEENTRIFYELIKEKKLIDAVQIALADADNLRSRDVVNELKDLFSSNDPQDGLLEYFLLLTQESVLNHYESILFCRLASYKQQLIENLLSNKKLTLTEKLGDILKSIEPYLAVSVYGEVEAHEKAMECLMLSEKYEEIPDYAKKTRYKPDYLELLTKLMEINTEKGCNFAQVFLNKNIAFNDYEKVIEIFLKYNLIQECTSFLLELLKHNRESEGYLQTKLLEINLLKAPEIADAILGNQMLTHFDRHHIRQLCENVGLVHRALELYTDLNDIKRLIVHTHVLDTEWLVGFFGLLSTQDAYECLKTMLEANIRQNVKPCAQVMIKHYNRFTLDAMIQLVESFNSYEGLYYFLNPIIMTLSQKDLHFKYIEAACKMNELKEVERMCKESNFYDAEKVKKLLLEAKLSDPSAFFTVCYRFNFIYDLIVYLYQNKSIQDIENYIQKEKPQCLPVAVGALIDVGCSDEFIKKLIVSVNNQFSYEELIREADKHKRIEVLEDCLEEMVKNGSKQAFVHTALAKVYIQLNKKPDVFLKENRFYITRIIGNYCEKHYPHLALLAYDRGQCDDDMIRICDNRGMFKQEADYLIKRNKRNLWIEIFRNKNPNWRKIFDNFLSLVLTEKYNRQHVRTAVEAILLSDLKNEFLEMLEHTIPHESMLYSVSYDYLE